MLRWVARLARCGGATLNGVSRGPGRVERFVLGHLGSGLVPAAPSLGWSAREIAVALTGVSPPPRSAVSSVARAIRELESAGLVEVMSPRMRRPGANIFARLRSHGLA